MPARSLCFYTRAAVREFDRRAIDEFGVPGIRLMQRAGRGAFEALRSRWPQALSVTIVCGSGNNAGDGFVVAGCAKDAGLDVQLLQIADPRKVVGDAAEALRFAEARLGAVVGVSGSEWEVSGDVVVDALLGTGARGAVRDAYQDAIDRVNAARRPILALDIPSGVDADTGGLSSPRPIRAAATMTFVAPKIGLVTGNAVDYVGELLVNDLDLPASVCDRPGIRGLYGSGLVGLDRRRGAHKGDFGRLLVIGGESDMGGAVLLAGEAGLRTGAGLVNIATRGSNRAAILARRPELMVRDADGMADIEDLVARATAIAVGPGLGRGDWGKRLLLAAVGAGRPLVVDADGLNLVADVGNDLPANTVITPHPGEAGRLLGKDAAWVQQHRPEAAARLSNRGTGGLVAVLKGAGTLIAREGVVESVCLEGNPGMATAGSGDVLTGIVGALLAGGLDPLAAAELGVWLHARAGDEARAGRVGSLIASDLIESLRLDA